MSLALAGYYHYWEKCIFNAITKCIIFSMATFLALLQSKDRPPLCEVKANLNGKDLVVTPTVNDIYKYLTKSVKNIVESARMFVRWMHGTCCQTAPQVSWVVYIDYSMGAVDAQDITLLRMTRKGCSSWRLYRCSSVSPVTTKCHDFFLEASCNSVYFLFGGFRADSP